MPVLHSPLHFCNLSWLNTVCSAQSRNCCQDVDHDVRIQLGPLGSTQAVSHAVSQAGDRERWETGETQWFSLSSRS